MNHDGPVIIYDGDCPFCTAYVKLVRLREAIGPVTLINARDGGPEVDQLWRKGFDLNEGMALIYQGQIYYGEDCVHRLALMSTGSGLFNKINARLFASPTASRLLYPVLKTGRRVALFLLRRGRLSAPEGA